MWAQLIIMRLKPGKEEGLPASLRAAAVGGTAGFGSAEVDGRAR